MSEGLNKVMLIGNLGQDPELKFINNGQAVLNIRLATTERYKAKNGERQERTEWHSVTVWGNRAEALNKILTKGKTIYVEGRLETRQWEKDGQKRYSTSIVANEVLLLGGKREERGAERSEARGESKPGGAASDSAWDDADDQMPF